MILIAESVVYWGGIIVKRLVMSQEVRTLTVRFAFLIGEIKEKVFFAKVFAR